MVLRIEAGVADIESLMGEAGSAEAFLRSNRAISRPLGVGVCRIKGRRAWKGANDHNVHPPHVEVQQRAGMLRWLGVLVLGASFKTFE